MRSTTIRLWALLLLAAVPLAAQEEAITTPAAEEAPFFEAVEVNVVNLDVFVTDKQGRPVLDLERDDFEVLVDRRPVPVTNFYAVENGTPRGPAALLGGAGSTAPQAPPEAAEEPTRPSSQRLFLIVYVDNFNIRPLNRNRVFRRLREFLHDEVDLADQVMLVSYDRSLNVRQAFTSDSGLIARALYDLEELTGHAVGRDSERRELLEAIDEAGSAREVEWRITQFAESLANDLSFTLSALKEFVESLVGLEGRKAILYVSDGLPMNPADELFQAFMHKFMASAMSPMQEFSAHRRFRELAAAASSGRVSFYTIDAGGLRGSIVHQAAARGLQTPGLPTLVDSTYIRNLQEPLRFMAEETGGRAIVNTNDILPGLEQAARDFQTYYSLGFMPGHFGDGRYHRVRVTVPGRSELEIRHRAGYRVKDPAARMADGTRSTMLYGFGSNPLGVTLAVGKSRPNEDGLFVVPVRIDIPIGSLELVPQGDFYVGRVNLYVNALDQEGGTSDTQRVPLSIRIPRDEIEFARSQPYVYIAQLQMRGGSHRMALGVRDEIGATESFVAKSVVVGTA